MEVAGTQRLIEAMGWIGAKRHDGAIARVLANGDAVDAVYNIDSATIADCFFHWLDFTRALEPVRRLTMSDKKRTSIEPEVLTFTYLLRCLSRIPSMNSLPSLLFADKGLMRRAGFNARQIEEGLTQRGANRTGKRTNLPIDPEMLSNNIVKLDASLLRSAVAESLHRLWRTVDGVPSRIMAAIDGTLISVGPSAKDGAWTKRKRRVRTKEGFKTIEESIYGYVLVWAYEPFTGLPLSFAFGKANADEKSFVGPLLDMADKALAGVGKIDVVVIDRGYFSGPLLHELDRRGLRFIIPAKKNTRVWEEAHAHAGRTESALARYEDSRVADGVRLDVVGIESLRTFETYAPADKVNENGHVDKHKKSFEAKPINAVVLQRHDGYDDPNLILLTNGDVRKPLRTYDDYDDRSLIENKNRCLKQDFHLCRPPQRNYKAAEIHCMFVILAYACSMAHMLYMERQQRLIERNEPSTLGDYMRQLARENRDQVIIFYEQTYGIFYMSEVLMLRGVRVKQPNARAAKTPEELFARVGFDDPTATIDTS